MALFVIIGHDVVDSSAQRKLTRPEHVARIKVLDGQNRLLIAGPTPITHEDTNMTGSIIIADFDSLEDVQAWCNEEPYLREGVYSHVDIKPFIKALPAE